MDVLVHMARHAGHVVAREDLLAALWPGTVVTDDALTRCFYELRRHLSHAGGDERYRALVETLPKRGYRLNGTVVPLGPDSAAHSLAPKKPAPPRSQSRLRSLRQVLFDGRPHIAGAGRDWWVSKAEGKDAIPPIDRGGARIPHNSIAVLPFADLSPARDQQYFADGIAEDILNLLSKATTLRVIARTSSFSFRGKDADVTRIAEVLGVTHVLEGSVRKAGERIRVTVRLVDASDGSRLWSESYDQQVGDILALQTDVARSVAAALKANLQNDVAVAAAKRVNTEAYDLYLRGQQKLRVQSFNEAERYFEQVIAIDAEFIPGYYGLGMAYVMQVVDVQAPMAENRDRLRDVVRRAQRLAPDDTGLLALSAQLARYDGDIQLAEERFATALQKDPSNGALRSMYAMFKLDQRDLKEALALDRRSLEIDPLNLLTYINVWASYMDLWNAEEAIAAAAHHREVARSSDAIGARIYSAHAVAAVGRSHREHQRFQ